MEYRFFEAFTISRAGLPEALEKAKKEMEQKLQGYNIKSMAQSQSLWPDTTTMGQGMHILWTFAVETKPM